MISIDPIRPYLPLLYAGTVAVLLGLLWLQGRSNANLRERLREKNEALQGFRDAQSTNLDTIGQLQASLTSLLEALRIERDRAVAAATDAQRAIDRVNAAHESTKRELANVYARSSSARAWGAVGVDRDVADRLPEHADRPN